MSGSFAVGPFSGAMCRKPKTKANPLGDINKQKDHRIQPCKANRIKMIN